MVTNGCTEHCLPFLKRIVTLQTFQHSLGVMHVMGELAEIYSLDRTRAMTTVISDLRQPHDCFIAFW